MFFVYCCWGKAEGEKRRREEEGLSRAREPEGDREAEGEKEAKGGKEAQRRKRRAEGNKKWRKG